MGEVLDIIASPDKMVEAFRSSKRRVIQVRSGGGQVSNDRLLEIITAGHAQLAAFGRESYALNGRGLIRVEYLSVAPGMTANLSTHMLYEDAETVRDLMADYPEIADDAAITLGMIDTYDPEKQVVVLASFQGGNPIAMKMRLDIARPAVLCGRCSMRQV